MVALLANMVIPLMHVACGAVVVLNVIIGCIEGLVIARFCRVSRRAAIQTMIAANFTSSFVGFIILVPAAMAFVDAGVDGPPLHTEPLLLGAILSFSCLGSLIVEASFAIVAGRGGGRTTAHVLLVFSVVQLLTHAGVTACLLLMSSLSLYTELELHRDLTFIPDDAQAWVYYIDADDGSLRRIRLNGEHPEHVLDAAAEPNSIWGYAGTMLHLLPCDDSGDLDLFVDGEADRLLIPAMAKIGGVFRDEDGNAVPSRFSGIADMRAPHDRPWTVTSGHFFPGGFEVREYVAKDDASLGLAWGRYTRMLWRGAFHHPWMEWPWRAESITILPGGLTVMELDPAQIIVVDVENRRLGYLARGHGPVVVIEEP